MKTSKLIYIAWVCFALALSTTTVFAQGRGNRINANRSNCTSFISGLSEEQEKQIEALEQEHLTAMAELRNQQRSTIDAIKKSELRTDMLKKVEAHRNSVKGVLTANQQKQYDELRLRGNYGRNQQFANANGNRKFSRNGNRQFARTGTCFSNNNYRGRGRNFQQTCANGISAAQRGNRYNAQNASYRRGYGRYN